MIARFLMLTSANPHSAIRISKFFLLCSLLLAPCYLVQAQPTKIPRIGFLGATSPSDVSARVEALRQGLGELGYVEGKNILTEWRYGEGKRERLTEFAAEFVRLRVDVIVTAGPGATRAAKAATSAIPIVMGFDFDPVGNGFVASLAHPGGNITGLSTLAPEISGKQLELLKEVVPKLSRVAVLRNPTTPGAVQTVKEIEGAARALKLQLQSLDVLDPKEIENVFREARKARADAILVVASSIFESHRTQVTDLAAKHRLPAVYHAAEFVEAGGLMTYGVSFADLFRRAATYVDKILKGRAPADLPVEQPKKFEFIVNLKAAKQIGLTFPPNVLVRADRVMR